jgi:Peptidase A4 family
VKRVVNVILLAVLVAAGSVSVVPPVTAYSQAVESVLLAPAVLSSKADPPALGYHGGTTLVVGRVRTSVTTCQLKLLSRQSFPVAFASNVRACHVNFFADVTIGPNPKPVYRTVAFELIARDAAGQFSRGVFYVQIAPKGSTYVAPPPPVVRTAPPAPPTAPKQTSSTSATEPPVEPQVSDNWSGYTLQGNGFTDVMGTFSVPKLVEWTPSRDVTSEWVGIDGANSADANLIQAGVAESMEPCTGTFVIFGGVYDPSKFYICPWTFLIQNDEPAEGPVPQLTVSAGDQVSVVIKVSGGIGYIRLSDDTTGEQWSTEMDYSGPLKTAEWITEAPTFDGSVAPLAPYTSVNFSGIGVPPTASISEVRSVNLFQNGMDVSTPTPETDVGALLTDGFSTTY